MAVVITGGLGFVGVTLARRLLDRHGSENLVLFDMPGTAEPPVEILDRARIVRGDLRDADLVRTLLAGDEVTVFHLASVVSGQAEQDFDLALSVNLDGTRNLLDACRAFAGRPRLVFASTLAAFGGTRMPETVDDRTKPTPQTTYGVTKVISELLLNDYTRKGFLDGRAARLPTVIVRPGGANAAASGFASAVFREPLAGRNYVLPVALETRMPVIGVRTAVDCLMALAELDGDALGDDRAVNLPSISVTVEEMVASLRRVAGAHRLGGIAVEPDPAVERIVRTWPLYAEAERARELGLPADDGLDQIVVDYIDDWVDGGGGR